jgi:hypothetical protein
MEEKGVGQEQLQKMKESLDVIEKKLELLDVVKKKTVVEKGQQLIGRP